MHAAAVCVVRCGSWAEMRVRRREQAPLASSPPPGGSDERVPVRRVTTWLTSVGVG